jgi:hypothetical protein
MIPQQVFELTVISGLAIMVEYAVVMRHAVFDKMVIVGVPVCKNAVGSSVTTIAD